MKVIKLPMLPNALGSATAASGRVNFLQPGCIEVSTFPENLCASTTRLLMCAFVAFAVTGCASVNVQRGKDLSTAGVQYTRATATLVDAATDAMIDSDSEAFVRTKLPAAALSKPELLNKLRDNLQKSNDGLVLNTRLFTSLRSSLSTVEAYFKALQSLAENPQSQATASAVSTLSDRVNGLNKVLQASDGPVRPVISDAQKTALSGLTKLVADQIHGTAVGSALKRDAPAIGEALLLQEQVLGLSQTIILGALNDQTNRFEIDNIRRPFDKQEIGSGWVTDRNKFIRSKALGETSKELQAARFASQLMSKTWEKILSGVYDTSEIRLAIEEVDALASALTALKQAEKPKSPMQ